MSKKILNDNQYLEYTNAQNPNLRDPQAHSPYAEKYRTEIQQRPVLLMKMFLQV